MEVFLLTLEQMLMMFTLIVIGFILKKTKILPDNSDKTMSRLETYLFIPALNFFNQLSKCTVDTFKANIKLMGYGIVILACAIALAHPLSHMFVRRAKGDSDKEYLRNIYKYSMTFGNFGFLGNFLALGLFGADGLFKYSLFTFFISMTCHSWGLFLLIPKKEGASIFKNLLNGFLKPPTVAMLAGMAGGLIGIKGFIPDFFVTACENASACMGPVSMVLAGVVIGGYNVKMLLSDKKVYVATFLRLVAIPSAILLVLELIGTDKEIMVWALIAFASPLGLNTVVFPAAYGGQTKTGAAMALISHLLSVITIPIMYYLFIVLI